MLIKIIAREARQKAETGRWSEIPDKNKRKELTEDEKNTAGGNENKTS